jgi:FlaA1/EpsC-like NDP-sugar epimerase
MLIRVSLTAMFSGITVLATKAISSLLTLTMYKMFTYWITYVILCVLIVSALLTLYYTNKALSRFDSTQVLPSEFAGFTFFAVVGSAMLYHDFEGASFPEIGLFMSGCLTSFLGVYFISSRATSSRQEVRGSRSIRTMSLGHGSQFNDPVLKPLLFVGQQQSDESDGNLSEYQNEEVTNVHEKRKSLEILSRTGLNGLVAVINALTVNRASLLFQQVVEGHETDIRGDREKPDV